VAVTTIPVTVAGVEPYGPDVRALRLIPEPGAALPAFSPGSHVIVHVPGERVRRNPYSLACAPSSTEAYRIVVRRIADGRGGSRALHDEVEVGDRLQIEPPRNLFAPVLPARRHLLIAGGIGITPFLSYAHQLRAAGVPFELHYGVRDGAAIPLLDELQRLCTGAGRLAVYVDPKGASLLAVLEPILGRQPLGTHVSTCGPAPMMEAVVAAARRHGWPSSRVHLERFQLDLGPADPFAVRLGLDGRELQVGADESLLEALESAGVQVSYLCRQGVCGECRTGVLAGVPDHRDAYLTAPERAANTAVMPCVSRCASGPLVLDLV
jgi:ferredoxin-NADP reductase